jgi:predicted kinase
MDYKGTLLLLRGLPGSGKSTAASLLGCPHFEADQYFMNNGVYEWSVEKLHAAHLYCRSATGYAMDREEPLIAVSNTFTKESELNAYYDLAAEKGYRVISLIVENRHNGNNVHGVPQAKLEEMKNRFSIKLIADNV